ncbi:MAG: HlyD family efflux transporter periplasmic adaptor subunit [Sphingobacteriia bacterium]|nr:HlyD family efflux transporter periplasmic adaptor subunit [Sphingobacteriia bacterium]
MALTRPRWRLMLLLLLILAGLAGGAAGLHASGVTPDKLLASLRGWLFEPGLPAGLAMGNGRIEATEVDVATKLAGRLIEVRVQEGERVAAGEVLAVLETESLEAQQRQAEAELRRAHQEREYARAVEEQQTSELDLARRDLARLERLARTEQFVSAEQIDQARTRVRSAEAAARASAVRVVAAAAAIESAQADLDRIAVDIADSQLKAPRAGRVLYRLAEPGEVLGPGGKVLTLLDLADVYMVIFLPTAAAGQLALGSPARIVLDAAPDLVIPASVSFVAARAQFTPKQVETQSVRENLSFRVKVRIDPALLARHEPLVKTGLPGVAYVQVAPTAVWPSALEPRLPSWPSPSSD